MPGMTDTLIIFRVENERGYGPYTSWATDDPDIDRELSDLAERHTDWRAGTLRGGLTPDNPEYRYLHPGPTQDPAIRDRWRVIEWSERARTHRFGFDSTERLHDWFHGERDVLERAGMKVAEYRVPAEHVLLGDFQAIFDADQAERIGERPLSELIEF